MIQRVARAPSALRKFFVLWELSVGRTVSRNPGGWGAVGSKVGVLTIRPTPVKLAVIGVFG